MKVNAELCCEKNIQLKHDIQWVIQTTGYEQTKYDWAKLCSMKLIVQGSSNQERDKRVRDFGECTIHTLFWWPKFWVNKHNGLYFPCI